MVEMKVYGLAMDETSQAPVLILKDLGLEMGLPIWIGAVEAMAISLALNKVAFPRPMTHDLLLNVIAALSGKVERIEVTALEEGTFYAEIVVRQNDGLVRIDARPSDAVALAIRADAPIFAGEEVLEKAGTRTDISEKTVLTTENADKWKDLLDKLSEDEIKYKM